MAEPVIGDVFRRAARHARDHPAVSLGDANWTFGQLDANGNRLARSLLDRGLRRGDRLALWSDLSIDFAALFVAAAKLGVALLSLAPMFGRDEAAEALRSIEPALVVCDTARVEQARQITGGRAVRVATLADLAAGAASLACDDVTTEPVRGSDPHLLYLTSGTTGRSKVVITSHRTNMLRGHPGGVPDGRGPAVCTFPLFHMAGWSIAMNQWFAHAHVVLLKSVAAGEIYAALTRYGAERIQCVPVVWQRLIDHIEATPGAPEALAHLRFADAGVASMPPALLERIQRALPHACVRVTYGSSEGGLITLLAGEDLQRKGGTCGVPGPFTDLRIEDGEILVRSPALFDGYLGDAHATSAARDAHGWYHTGDAGFLDEDGYLTLTGRVRDVLRSGGEFVSPTEVEAILAEHDNVADVAVVGLPDPLWGDLVCAVVVPRSDPAPTLESLVGVCGGRLAPYKRPRRLVIVSQLPRTAATGRLIRAAVLELIMSIRSPSS
jgi:acyl-CoA synthetase (AMP-forming)/AMP-acid ligase II